MVRWTVDVGYEDTKYPNDDVYDIIAKWYGTKSDEGSSGMGFGTRDIQYTFYSRKTAGRVASLFKDIAGTEYAEVYWDPKSTVVYLLHMHEYKEAWRWLTRAL